MPTAELLRIYSHRSADECFAAAQAALPKVGFEIWKTRPLAWLVIAHRQTSLGRLNTTIAVRPGQGAEATISVSGDEFPEDTLEIILDQVITTFEKELV